MNPRHRVACARLFAGLWLFGVVAGPRVDAQSKPMPGFEQFRAWVKLVRSHAPGELDASASTVAKWSQNDLAIVHADLWAVVTLVGGKSNAGDPIQYSGAGELVRTTQRSRPARMRAISSDDVPGLLDLPADPATRHVSLTALSAFMKRAAMLHTDIAMLAAAPTSVNMPATAAEREKSSRRVVDGEDAGWDARPIHWELARTALDGVHPKPGDDPLVAAWYQSTAAYMAFRLEYGYLGVHLAKALTILPNDGRLQFYNGVRHEAYAAPPVQSALAGLSSLQFRPDVKSPDEELKLAEGSFRRALNFDAALVNARVHLGRVLGLLGRHEQARAELTLALSSLQDPRQRYYAELFLGDTERRAGQVPQANEAYARAAILFPNAQTPRLGLSQLAWEDGDRTAAQESFRTMVTMSQGEDPWWSYELSAVLDVAVLVENLRRLAVEQLSR